MTTAPQPEFHYRVPWRAGNLRPGHHGGTRHGSGLEFSGHVPLLAAPDPRRIDPRASLADPFGRWLVRRYRQRASIAVYLLADLSASMGFTGHHRKMDVLADFAQALSHSVYRAGDAFGFIGCDSRVRTELLLPATHARGAGLDAAAAIRRLQTGGNSAAGLAQAACYLARSRSLVFLASDFHLPLSLLDAVLDALGHHVVIPVVLWDKAEGAPEAGFGLTELVDAESGRRRTVFLRPALRQRWRQAAAQRREQLDRCFARHDVRPFFLDGAFRPDAMTSYFYGGD